MQVVLLYLSLTSQLFASEHIYIYAKDYKAWPFKQKEYMLGCLVRGERKLIFINDENNNSFGINGQGREYGKQLLAWKDGILQLKKGRLPIDLQPFIEKGLTLCD